MKILNVNLSIDSLTGGGTAERTFQMSNFLAEKGFDCTILTLSSELSIEKMDALKNVKVTMLSYWSNRFYIPRKSLRTIRNLVKNADIIHLMNHWTLLNAFVYLFAKSYKKPYVVCPAGALQIMGRSKIIKSLFNLIIGNKIIKNANGHIAIAENELDQYQSYGVSKEKITLIPNGVHLAQLKNEGEATSFSFPYILFMGRLNSIKGPDILLDAFSELAKETSHHLIFAGPDGGMLSSLKKKVSDLELEDKIHFYGSVSGNEKSALYENSSFLVIPSRKEAMSIVLLESGVFGKPAVITDQCGFNSLEKIQGGLVVPANKEGVKQGLAHMLSNTNREEMGNNLKQLILKNYTWDSVGQKIINLYHAILRINS
ncbi:glycosyltransferase (plasmid) [Legionella adelaidensis]|uniref:Glycosyltransferase n=1 Tax=Legionella adelaidensis TaxID=45056 RepID=A0A0W0R4M6_9GAMM|nr:glycosyltransferase [Legionella adelaidensis]KTC66036.1 glycosyltransferase [Legionella adelaidensis]VEH85695.1 glycosyltransferase [Legionella adelaidensis]